MGDPERGRLSILLIYKSTCKTKKEALIASVSITSDKTMKGKHFARYCEYNTSFAEILLSNILATKCLLSNWH